MSDTTTVGISPPRINNNDRGPGLIIAAAVMLSCTMLSLGVRLYSRWPWSRNLRADDYVLCAAILFAIANTAAVGVSVHNGFGQREVLLSTQQIDQSKKAFLASYLLLFISEGLAACAYALLLLRIVPQKTYGFAMKLMCGIASMWAFAGVVRMAASFNPSVADPNRATWMVFGALNSIMQAALFIASMWMIWPLQMATHRKLGWSIWFALCVPIIACIALRLASTPSRTFDPDWTFRDTLPSIYAQVELHLININATYASLRSFLDKASTGFIVSSVPPLSSSKSRSGRGVYGHGTHNGTGAYGMQPIGAKGGSGGSSSGGSKMKLRADIQSIYTPTVNGGGVSGDRVSVKSYDSQAIMVRRSVDVQSTT